MRFFFYGTGWECAAPIRTLGRQVETAWVERQPTDGTKASSSHAKWPLSDHGPDPRGIVRAIDVGVVDSQGDVLTEQLRATRDGRIAYVIHNRRMFSSYDHSEGRAWTWRPYRGANPHATHVHVSTRRDPVADGDPVPFRINLGDPMAFISVAEWQDMLNELGVDPPLDVDDDFGPLTRAALVDQLRSGGVTVEWVNGRIERATRNVLRYGHPINPKRVPES